MELLPCTKIYAKKITFQPLPPSDSDEAETRPIEAAIKYNKKGKFKQLLSDDEITPNFKVKLKGKLFYNK